MNARCDYYDIVYLIMCGCPAVFYRICCRNCKYNTMCFIAFPPITRSEGLDDTYESITIYAEGEL